MVSTRILAVAGLVICAALIAGCFTPSPAKSMVTLVLAKGTGPMPTLLGTGQIDGYIAWQPFVEVAPLAGIGKVVVYSQDLPPAGRWVNHPCCVFTARDDVLAGNPDLVNALAAVTILSTDYVNAHPDESAEIVADWLAGKGNFTYGNISVSSVKVLQQAIPTVRFTNEPTEKWMDGNLEFVYALRELGAITGSLTNTTDDQTRALLFSTAPYYKARSMIDNHSFVVPATADKEMGIGYLNSDHDAALFVAVKKWQYFNNTYGIALVPRDTSASRPELADLVVNGKKVATFRLIPGDAGPQLMQMIATDTAKFAYVGNPPTIAAVDKNTPVKIIMALNTEGSGLVVSNDSPATNWTGFVQWAKDRSAQGRPIKIADPGKGSIQDIMIRYALEESGLSFSEG